MTTEPTTPKSKPLGMSAISFRLLSAALTTVERAALDWPAHSSNPDSVARREQTISDLVKRIIHLERRIAELEGK